MPTRIPGSVPTAGVCGPARGSRAGQAAKSRSLDDAVHAGHQILRLDVAVDHPRGVGCGQGAGRLPDQPRQLGHRRTILDELHERLSLDQLHAEERPAVAIPAVIDRADVRMIQRRGRERLAAKAFQPGRVLGTLLGQELERDLAVEAKLPGRVHDSHSAAAEQRAHLVAGNGGENFQALHVADAASPSGPRCRLSTPRLFSPRSPGRARETAMRNPQSSGRARCADGDGTRRRSARSWPSGRRPDPDTGSGNLRPARPPRPGADTPDRRAPAR